jgi:hypothetical protein
MSYCSWRGDRDSVDDKTVVNHGVELENGGGIPSCMRRSTKSLLLMSNSDWHYSGRRRRQETAHEDKPKVAGHTRVTSRSSTTTAMHTTAYSSGNRLYQTVTEEEIASAKADRQRFLDSFELIE